MVTSSVGALPKYHIWTYCGFQFWVTAGNTHTFAYKCVKTIFSDSGDHKTNISGESSKSKSAQLLRRLRKNKSEDQVADDLGQEYTGSSLMFLHSYSATMSFFSDYLYFLIWRIFLIWDDKSVGTCIQIKCELLFPQLIISNIVLLKRFNVLKYAMFVWVICRKWLVLTEEPWRAMKTRDVLRRKRLWREH